MAKVSKDIPVQDDSVEQRVDAMMDPRVETAATPPTEPIGPPPLAKGLLKEEKSDVDHKKAKPALTTEVPKLEPELEEVAAEDIQIKPLDIDNAQSDAAIDDIVAQEADAVLAAEDANLLNETEAAEEPEPEPAKKGHPIFWFIIFMLALVAIIAAVMVTNPNHELPFLN